MGAFIETTLKDIRYAARILTRSPGFTLFAVLTIALGARRQRGHLQPGGWRAAEVHRLSRSRSASCSCGRSRRADCATASRPPTTWIGRSRAALSNRWRRRPAPAMSYTGGGEPKSLRAGMVSAPYFDVFGIKAAMGRTFAEDEDQPGKDKVAVISHRIWTNLFGGDPGPHRPLHSAERRALHRDRRAPARQRIRPAGPTTSGSRWYFPRNPARDYHSFGAVARLKPGVSARAGAGRDERHRGRHRRAVPGR